MTMIIKKKHNMYNEKVIFLLIIFSIKVWDTTTMLATSSFNQAQTDVVTSVEVQTGSDAIFLSTSMDSEALLWDTRKSKPALG